MSQSPIDNNTYVGTVKQLIIQLAGDLDLTSVSSVDIHVYKPDVDGNWEEVIWSGVITQPPTLGEITYTTIITPTIDLDYSGDYIVHPLLKYSGGAENYSDPFILRVKNKFQI